MSVCRTASPSASSIHSVASSAKSEGYRSDISSILGPDKEQVLSDRMRRIVTRFRRRAFAVRQRLEKPPSPDDGSLSEEAVEQEDVVVDAVRSNKREENASKQLAVSEDIGLVAKLKA
jgi:hypothetical protein